MFKSFSNTVVFSIVVVCLAGCAGQVGIANSTEDPLASPTNAQRASEMLALYTSIDTEPHAIPALDLTKIDPVLRRQQVTYMSPEPVGSIVVDPKNHFLYLIEPDGHAMRYGVAVGAESARWSGTAIIKMKQEWPDWYPTKEMLERRPDIKAMLTPLKSGLGIGGGDENPIGARGLYLWQGNKDTLYRIHGTTEPYTIGQSVSSGCIRMMNQDVVDLYGRVAVGTIVKVLPES